jgi:DUF4097 and DUF4098 domain-containing protein YvlB
MTTNLLRGLSPAALALLLAVPASADFELQRELALEPGGRFEIDADAGSLTVRGFEGSGVSVRITSAESEEEIAARYDIDFLEEAGRAAVRVKHRGRSWFGTHRDRLHLEIRVPVETDLDLETSGGGIEVRGIVGRVDLETSGGRVEIEDITGEVDAHTSGGGMEAIDIEGDARLRTSGGRVSIDGVTGDLYASSSGGSIEVRDAAGHVDVSTSGGPITAYLATGNGAGGSLSTSGGSVTVYVDPGVGLEVDASTSGGSVSLDMPVTVQGRLSRSSISGTLNGGGPTLRLRSSGGSIRLKSL